MDSVLLDPYFHLRANESLKGSLVHSEIVKLEGVEFKQIVLPSLVVTQG